jgi:hypothetical protein
MAQNRFCLDSEAAGMMLAVKCRHL